MAPQEFGWWFQEVAAEQIKKQKDEDNKQRVLADACEMAAVNDQEGLQDWLRESPTQT